MLFPDEDNSHKFKSHLVGDRSIIRNNIKNIVDDIQWIEKQSKYSLVSKILPQSLNTFSTDESNVNFDAKERCVVCTLPWGKCQHGTIWFQQTEENRFLSSVENELEREIESILEVVSNDSSSVILNKIDRVEDEDGVDIHHMIWQKLKNDSRDRIGSEAVSLFDPKRRLWHSTTVVGPLVVVFGGVVSKNAHNLLPLKSVTNIGDLTYLADIRIYNPSLQTWQGVRDLKLCGLTPSPRYGHVAEAIDEDTLFVFGGRGEHGAIFGDTWVYSISNNRWTCVVPQADNNYGLNCGTYSTQVLSPPPRFHAASCSIPSTAKDRKARVLLHGGTSGVDNFGDLWLFHCEHYGREGVGGWERVVALGLPASPRYGHQLLYCNGQAIVLGGCSVSPESEVVGSGTSPQEVLLMMAASAELQHKYKVEGESALLSTAALYSDTSSISSVSQLLQNAGGISSLLHLREKDTRAAEQAMTEAWKMRQAAVQLTWQRARHCDPHLDLHFLRCPISSSIDLLRASFVWERSAFPKCSGTIPSARIHFSAATKGSFVFIIGGASPTSLTLNSVDGQATRGKGGIGKLFALDLKTNCWTSPSPVNSYIYKEKALAVARSDLLRARSKWQAELARGRALGAQGGRTREAAVAEAIVRVCRWRRDALLHDDDDDDTKMTKSNQQEKEDESIDGEDVLQQNIIIPREYSMIGPGPRFGATLTPLGQRLLYIGGITEIDDCSGEESGEVLVLDMEHEDVKVQRLETELHTRLELERQEYEKKINAEDLLTAHELQEKVLEERRHREREQAEMARADYMSSLPALSCPASVKYVKSNRHTIWVEWDTPKVDSSGRSVDPSRLQFMLYIKRGFQNFLVGDKVRVLPPPTFGLNTTEKKKKHKQIADLDSINPQDMFFDISRPRFPGTISKVHKRGLFDVQYDDGGFEARIARHRLTTVSTLALTWSRSANFIGTTSSSRTFGDDIEQSTADVPIPTVCPGPEWVLVYVGSDTSYACENLVPDVILEEEPELRVPVVFALQISGLDYPSYERSQLSRPVIFRTTPDERVGILGSPACIRNQNAVESKSAIESATNTTSIPRARKQVIQAVVGERMARIERREFSYYSEGTGDDFL